MKNPWYKNAIMYSLDVKTFCDSDGDGTGDFQGLIGKLDYLSSLGINCIWLQPFHPSPKVDNGYDVKDYYNVDPLLGNLSDFAQLIEISTKKGIRIIMDLVVNHTSIEHPWFLDSKSSRDSKYRHYYIWDDSPKEDKEKIMFEGLEDSIWEYSKETKSYYLHKYFKEQADLNMANPEVKKEILKIMGFWLKMGVSGFRIDAAHVITDPTEVEHIDFDNLHQLFEEMRDFIEEKNPEAILIGEASVTEDELPKYFSNGSGKPRMHMLFNFLANKYIFLAFARQKGSALSLGIKRYQSLRIAHWVNFIRHHDELNLELLNEHERKEVWDAFAPMEHMKLFGRGIRRRLPPMVRNDFRKLKLFYAINFSLPGTPLICYGEEIGMGDDLGQPGRKSVRTVMQWSAHKSAGFSSEDPDQLYMPVINKGDYSYKKINVEQQQNDLGSFLNFIRRLIATRKNFPQIGAGDWEQIETSDEKITSICYKGMDDTLLVVYNLSEKTTSFNLDLSFAPENIEEVYYDSNYEGGINLQSLQLKPFGFRWFRISEYRN